MSKLLLELASDDLFESEADGYPSRNEQNAQLISRQGTIVYASKEQDSPVDQSFINTYNEQGFVVLDDVFTPFPGPNVFFVYNALSNKVVNLFCAQAPGPEHICSRENIYPVQRSQECKLNA